MKTLWFYTITLLSLLLVGCNNGDDGFLDIPSGWAHNAASLVVTPKNGSVPIGLTQQMHADAVLQNNVVVDVTTNEALTWTSSDAAIATIDDNGLVKGMATGTVTITAEGVNNDGSVVKDTATVTVTNAVVQALQVTPANETTPIGLTKAFTATAIFSDKSTMDVTNDPAISWSSSDISIASIIMGQSSGNGVAKGEKPGTVTITAKGATGGTTFQGTATLTVTDAVVTELQVTPTTETTPVGLTKAFTAIAVLSDDRTMDVTNDPAISWLSNDSSIASIITGQSNGNGVAKGEKPGIVTVTAKGAVGGTTFEGSATLTVTDAVVTALQVTPTTETTPVGLTKAFTAIAVLSDDRTMDVTNDPAISWTSDNPSIATITSGQATGNGIATGETIGEASIKATGFVNGQTFEGSATLTVTDAVVTVLQVTPTTETTPVGLTKAFTAIAVLSDDRTIDVTNDPAISWTSDNPSIATITSGQATSNGIATGETIGEASIKATGFVNGQTFEGSATLTVTDAVVTMLQVTPPIATTPVGLTKGFTATAVLSDDRTIDVTNDPAISWVSDTPSIATITSGQATGNGIATGDNIGEASIKATGFVNGQTFEGYATLTVTDAVVTALQVTPPIATTPVGLTKGFTATAVLSDDRTIDVTNNPAISWVSDTPSIATITSGQATGNGIATGENIGEASIKATGFVNGQTFESSATLTVTDAIITSLVVTPASETIAKGLEQQFIATAYLSNGHTSDVTSDPNINWKTDDIAVTVNSTGLAKGEAIGSANVIASFITPEDLTVQDSGVLNVTNAEVVSLQIIPPIDTTPIGLDKQFTATAIMTDGSNIPVTNNSAINWTSSDTSVATITSGLASGNGLAHGVSKGIVTVHAVGFVDGTRFEGTAQLEVTDAVPVNLTITPVNPSIAKGTEQQFEAEVALSSGLNLVVTEVADWSSSDTNVATITSSQTSGNGVSYGVDVGTANISSSFSLNGVTVSNTAQLSVIPATIVSVEVTPSGPYVPKGATQQFVAKAIMTDDSEQDITASTLTSWRTDNASIATVNELGLVQTLEQGVTLVQATYDGFTGETIIIVTDPVLDSITVTPNPIIVGIGFEGSGYLTAIGHFSDGGTTDLTDVVDWSGQDTAIAVVGSGGLVIGSSLGSTTTQASTTNSIGDTITSEPSTIDVKTLVSITVSPSDVSIGIGESQQLTVTGYFSDSTEGDISEVVTWNVTDPTIAVISEGAGGSLVSGGTAGYGVTTAVAMSQGISSNTVNISAINTLAGPVIDVFDVTNGDGTGQLYVNSPSVAYLDSIGGSDSSDVFAETTPVGDFYLYTWEQANILCDTYNAQGLAGRTNWRLPESIELEELQSTYSNLYDVRGWPVNSFYWSNTLVGSGPNHFLVSLKLDSTTGNNFTAYYASCTSEP
ncbi:TPA: Ig-like domain-containing protein [Vibrio parahaemolyticus]